MKLINIVKSESSNAIPEVPFFYEGNYGDGTNLLHMVYFDVEKSAFKVIDMGSGESDFREYDIIENLLECESVRLLNAEIIVKEV